MGKKNVPTMNTTWLIGHWSKGARALRDGALHLLRYCAALSWLGPQATAPAGVGLSR